MRLVLSLLFVLTVCAGLRAEVISLEDAADPAKGWKAAQFTDEALRAMIDDYARQYAAISRPTPRSATSRTARATASPPTSLRTRTCTRR
jgi:hypothetical protein